VACLFVCVWGFLVGAGFCGLFGLGRVFRGGVCGWRLSRYSLGGCSVDSRKADGFVFRGFGTTLWVWTGCARVVALVAVFVVWFGFLWSWVLGVCGGGCGGGCVVWCSWL